MKSLRVQIQPNRSPSLDAEASASDLQSLANGKVTRGDDNGTYLNIDYRVADVEELWHVVREKLSANQRLANCSIVCCEGEAGWDDYLLLHHYDDQEEIDRLT